MYCSKCGKEIKGDIAFCIECGARTTSPLEGALAAAAYNSANGRKGLKIFGITCAAIFTLLVLCIVSLLVYGDLTQFHFSFNYYPKEKNIQTQLESSLLSRRPQIQLTISGDIINSEIKDNIAQITTALPKEIIVRDVYFDTNNQRVYINSEYGIVKFPISCKVDLQGKGSKLLYSLSDFKYGSKNLPIPQFLINRIFDGSRNQEFNLQNNYNMNIQNIRFENGNAIVIIGL